MNKFDVRAEEDTESDNDEDPYNIDQFIVRVIKNCGVSEKLSAVCIEASNNIFATAAGNVVFVWEYESFKIQGICFVNDNVSKLFIIKRH